MSKTISVDQDSDIGGLLRDFLRKADCHSNHLSFLYNAQELKFDDTRKIKDFFKSPLPTIIFNDLENLGVGA